MKGSIRPRDRRKGGKGPCLIWELNVHLGYDEDGKRRRIFRVFHGRKRDAEVALDGLKAQVRSGVLSRKTDHTVQYAYERWIAVKWANSVEPPDGGRPIIDRQTVGWYEDIYRLHLKGPLGHRKLVDIKLHELNELFEGLHLRGRKQKKHEGEPLSVESLARFRVVLNQIFEYALDMNWIDVNLVKRLRLPRRSGQVQYRVLSKEESSRLIAAARGTRLFLVIFIAAVTGMRRGEVLALIWDDIDLRKGVLRVRRALRKDRSTKLPKTDNGFRTIDLPAEVVTLLRGHMVEQNKLRKRNPAYDLRGFLFAEDDGAPWLPNSISTLYRRIVKDSGIGKIKLHELRHSLASLLIAAGVDVATVSQMLGHYDEAFTYRRYVHPTNQPNKKRSDVTNSISKLAKKAIAKEGRLAPKRRARAA